MLLTLNGFPDKNLASPLTYLSIIMLLGKIYFYSCMSLVYACINPYLLQVCTNPTKLYNFNCRHRWTLELEVDAETIWTWRIHLNLLGAHTFQDAYPLYFSLVIGLSQWSMFHQLFFPLMFRYCIGAILASLHLIVH